MTTNGHTSASAAAAATSLGIYFLTFNCARTLVEPDALGAHLFDALPRIPPSSGNTHDNDGNNTGLPEILALSLQEIAPIADSYLGGIHLAPYLDRVQRAVDFAVTKAHTSTGQINRKTTGQIDADNASRPDTSHSESTEHSIPDENIHVLGHRRKSISGKLAKLRYKNAITRNVGMTALLIFVREDQMHRIEHIQTAGVGLGFWGTGNKGAVGIKLGLSSDTSSSSEGDENEDRNKSGVTEIAFVAAHLAPMEDGLASRNEDWKKIVQGLVFTPLGTAQRKNAIKSSPVADTKKQTHRESHTSDENDQNHDEAEPLLHESAEQEHEENRNGKQLEKDSTPTTGLYDSNTSYVFLGGDLNYRTSDTKPSPDDHRLYPQPNTHDDDQTHFSRLLERDQLSREMKAGKVLQGFAEAEITFPPTYKYSERQVALVPDDMLDKYAWSTHRWPSWCDRILFLSGKSVSKSYSTLDASGSSSAQSVHSAINTTGYTALPVMPTSDHRPVALSATVQLPSFAQQQRSREDERGDDLRISSPFSIDPYWRENRRAARQRELALGVLAYLSLTWEGNGLLLATVVGGVGGWLLLRSVLQT